MCTVNQTQTMAYEDLMKPDEDWRNLPDSTSRRRLQNRLAQRAYRRNLRKRNEEVEQLQQQVRELKDAARGNPPSQEFAAMELNMPWDISPPDSSSTEDQNIQNISLSNHSPAIEQHNNSQGTTTMDDFDFFMSFSDDTKFAQNSLPDTTIPHSIPTKKASPPHQPKPKKPRCLNRSRRSCTPSSISDPTEISTSLSTPSSTSSFSQRNHNHLSLMAPSLLPQSPAATPVHTPISTPTHTSIDSSASLLWNTMDSPNINLPRPSLSLVHLAVAAGNADTLRILLQDLALPVNKRDDAGYTPLQRAIMAGRTDLVAVLLENGAGASTDDESDWSLDNDLVAV